MKKPASFPRLRYDESNLFTYSANHLLTDAKVLDKRNSCVAMSRVALTLQIMFYILGVRAPLRFAILVLYSH